VRKDEEAKREKKEAMVPKKSGKQLMVQQNAKTKDAFEDSVSVGDEDDASDYMAATVSKNTGRSRGPD